MNHNLRDKFILVAACLMFLCCIPSFGQVLKGSLTGTVVDQQNAVVSGAQVKATHLATATTMTTTTDSSGSFRFNLIQPGDYKIEISAKGFKTSTESSVPVSSNKETALGSL